jgi:simple sugar transport system substrate-binding protein
MMDAGVDVFTSIAGGAAQGMIRTAVDRGAYIVWYNTSVYNLAPGIIAGCGIMEQKKLTMEILKSVLDGTMEYGISQTVGVKEGYIRFDFDDPHYQNSLPADIRQRFETFVNDYKW